VSEDLFLSPNLKNKLKREYEELKSLYEGLVNEVLYILRNCITKNEIKIHRLAPRETIIKTFESLCEKVVRKQIKNNHFEAIEDIAGVRVICLYRSDLEQLSSVMLFRLTHLDVGVRRRLGIQVTIMLSDFQKSVKVQGITR